MNDLGSQTIQLIGYILCIIISLVLVGLLLYRNSNVQAKVFSAIIICITIWILFNLFADYSGYNSKALFWSRLAILTPLFLGPLLWEFSEVFPKKEDKFDKRKFAYKFIPLLPLLLLLPTEYNVKSVELTDKGIIFQPGILYLIFGIWFFIQLYLVARNLLRTYHTSRGIPRYQIKFLGIGITVTIVIGITSSLILPVLNISQLAFIGPISTIVFFAFTTYSIKKYRLLDIQYILNRVIYTLLSAILVFSIFYIVAYTYYKLFGGIFNIGLSLIPDTGIHYRLHRN